MGDSELPSEPSQSSGSLPTSNRERTESYRKSTTEPSLGSSHSPGSSPSGSSLLSSSKDPSMVEKWAVMLVWLSVSGSSLPAWRPLHGSLPQELPNSTSGKSRTGGTTTLMTFQRPGHPNLVTSSSTETETSPKKFAF